MPHGGPPPMGLSAQQWGHAALGQRIRSRHKLVIAILIRNVSLQWCSNAEAKHQARCLSIRPSVHFLPLIRLKVARGLEPIPAAIGWEVGYILDIRSVTGLKQNARKPTTHYRIHAYNQFRIVSEPNPFMWDSGRKPEYLEGTQERGKHANSTRKGPRPLGCEATVLATDPPC